MEGIVVIISCASGVSCFVLSSVVVRVRLREEPGRGFVTHASAAAGLAGGWEGVECTLLQVFFGSATIKLQTCFW